MTTTRRNFMAGLTVAGTALALPRSAGAQAAWSPTKPIRLVVAYPAGGPTDVIARVVAQEISGRRPERHRRECRRRGGRAGDAAGRQGGAGRPRDHVRQQPDARQ